MSGYLSRWRIWKHADKLLSDFEGKFELTAGNPDMSVTPPWQILTEDGPILAVNKPPGLLTLGASPGVPTLERQVKQYLKEKYQKPGNVYLGIPHRLDRPVSGVILFARNSKAAGRLAEQFRERQVQKIYWGITESAPPESGGCLTDWLLKQPDKSHVDVVPPGTPGAKEAVLHYRVVCETPLGKLLEIHLETGRTHQIRAQLGSRGWPILGDRQYGAQSDLDPQSGDDPTLAPIALHARELRFLHPIRYDLVTLTAPLPDCWGNLNLEETIPAPDSEPTAVNHYLPQDADWDDLDGLS